MHFSEPWNKHVRLEYCVLVHAYLLLSLSIISLIQAHLRLAKQAILQNFTSVIW